MTKYDELLKYSDPARVHRNLIEYFGKDVPLYISNKPSKKYMIKKPDGKYVHIGQMGYTDFTRSLDKDKQRRYFARSMAIKGDWYNNPYSANLLSQHLLWM